MGRNNIVEGGRAGRTMRPPTYSAGFSICFALPSVRAMPTVHVAAAAAAGENKWRMEGK